MKSIRGRQAARGRLVFEALEARLVLDSQLGADLPADGPVWEPFESAERLQEYLLKAAVDRYRYLFGQPVWSRWMTADVPVAVNGGQAVDVADTSFSLERSAGTNTQVDGVDEGDFVKTDGSYLYVLRDRELKIIDIGDPGQMQIVASLSTGESFWPREIYVTGNRLTVISQQNVVWRYREGVVVGDLLFPDYTSLDPPVVQVAVYDVTDRAEPRLLEVNEIDGLLVQSRAVGEFVYVVTQQEAGLPYPQQSCTTDSPGEERDTADWVTTRLAGLTMVHDIWMPPYGVDTSNCRYESEADYVERVKEQSLDAALPALKVVDGQGTLISSGLLVAPMEIYHVIGQQETNVVSIVSFNVADGDAGPTDRAAALLNSSSVVYATESGIYLAATQWGDQGEFTRLARFALQDGQIDAAATGTVPGHLLNQFALDEYAGYLRVATTVNASASTTNRLFVLQEASDGRLDIVSELRDLAPGERIFAARFMGERAFLVTFRQVDPLFAIDLSNPRAPRVAGELKIPGFSSYLQMVSEELLVGLGRDADPVTGRSSEPKLSLFDLGDLTQPELLDSYVFDSLGWSHSEALYDHHAFGYFPSANVLVIPLETSGLWNLVPEVQGDVLWQPRHEFWVFQIATTPGQEGLARLGTIEHGSTVRRSFEVAGNLITVASDDIQVHPLLHPETLLGRISLRSPAVADYFAVESGSQDNVLDVLANDDWQIGADFPGITSVTQPGSGGMVTISADGRSVIFTPAPGFAGWDAFQYSVGDESADVQLYVKPVPVPEEPWTGDPLVSVRLETTDTDGNPIVTIEVGQEFRLNVYVDDLREAAGGVFSAYVDLNFDEALAAVAGDIVAGDDYANGLSGSADIAGLLDELGGFSGSIKQLGDGERLLASIPFRATRSGQLDFTSDPADDVPAHDFGLYGLNEVVDPAAITFSTAALQIVADFHNVQVSTDTDGDGQTSPHDVLVVINFLNSYGPQATTALADLGIAALDSAEGQGLTAARRMYYDVNGDNFVSSFDVLHIINSINRHVSSAEGEGPGAVAEVGLVAQDRAVSQSLLLLDVLDLIPAGRDAGDTGTAADAADRSDIPLEPLVTNLLQHAVRGPHRPRDRFFAHWGES